MARLLTLFLVLIAIQATLILYTDQTPESTTIWEFVWNVNTWNTLGLIIGISAFIGVLLASGVIGGTSTIFKTDTLLFGVMVAGLISIGVIFINLYRQVNKELISIFFPACAESGCVPAQFVLALLIGTVALYYVWTVIEWWRGKDV